MSTLLLVISSFPIKLVKANLEMKSVMNHRNQSNNLTIKKKKDFDFNLQVERRKYGAVQLFLFSNKGVIFLSTFFFGSRHFLTALAVMHVCAY